MSATASTTPPVLPDLELLPALEAAVIDRWVLGTAPGLQAIITAVHGARVAAGETRRNREQVEGYLRSAWQRLADLGLYRAQANKNGVRDALATRPGNAVHWLNLSEVSVEGAMLATVARPYLNADEADVSDAEKGRLRTALRLFLDLPDQCSEARILEAAGRLSLDVAFGLPERVMAKALAAGQAKQSAKNLRGAVRAAMRFAAGRRLCPVVFSAALVPGDDFVEAMEAHFPLAPTGRTPSATIHGRKGMTVLGLASRRCHGDAVTFKAMTRVQAEAVLRHLRVREGEEVLAREAAATLNKLAGKGVGPFTEPSPLSSFVVRTPSGPRPSIYLRDANGRAGAHDWEAVLGIIGSAGLPQETVDLLGWYGQWVSLPVDAFLELECPWPALLGKHRLSASSLGNRSVDVRAWIGCAVYECKLDPATLTPSKLFGEHFELIAKTLIRWWRSRQVVLRSLNRKHGAATKGTLHHIVVSAGMLAYGGYVRECHANEREIAVRQTKAAEHIDVTAETSASKTPAEQRYWNGYLKSIELAAGVKTLRAGGGARGKKGTKGARATDAPEFKDIRRIMAQTPPSWWLQMLDAMHEWIRAHVAVGTDHGREFHGLVQQAWELGLFITTGLRGEEACRLQLGVHVALDGTRVHLNADERKNVRPQTAHLQVRYLPADIHRLYLERTLPWLTRGQHEEQAARHEARAAAAKSPRVMAACRVRAEAARGRIQLHRFLIVNTEGGAPGNHEVERKLKIAVAAHGTRWKAAMMRRAIESGLTLPASLDFEFGRHCIRGAFGYALFQTPGQGLVAAANYLGDRLATVEQAYSAVDGVHVDVSTVAGFAVPDRGIAAGQVRQRAAASGGAAPQRTGEGTLVAAIEDDDFLTILDELRADLRAGVLTRDEYEELKAAYQRRRGRGGTPPRELTLLAG